MAFNWDWSYVRPRRLINNYSETQLGNWGIGYAVKENNSGGGMYWHSLNFSSGDGNSVVVIQQQLNKALDYWRSQGHPACPATNLNPDGVIGTKSDQAIRFYQGVMGLTVDGILGSGTWGLLRNE